jgi:UDP-N-acetylglucosamine--N-acetylmuramyl-(pentapeptide) pyrophosphoryl-undecaprenol N-acetylglucosamine transferase
MKICLIGGHPTPAIALMQYAASQNDRLFYVAAAPSAPHHHRELDQARVYARVSTIPTVKFDRHHKLLSIIKLPSLIYSTLAAYSVLKNCQPDLVVSFGGYVALPVGLAALLLHLPLVVHEQTAKAGLANRLLGKIAQAVVVSHSSSVPFFPRAKTKVLGNLVRQEFYTGGTKPIWLKKSIKPILLVTGASQGSAAINRLIAQSEKQLTCRFTLIHQIGNGQPARSPHPAYYPKDWISESELAWLMRHSQLMISRAGANTVSEIEATGIPAILIPLPSAQKNEQFHNASYLVKKGQAVIIKEKDLTLTTLEAAIAKAPKRVSSSQVNSNVPSLYKQLRITLDKDNH